MDQEKDLRWTYFTEPSGRFNGRYNTKKYNGGKYEAFSGYYSFACPVVFIRAGEVILNRAEAYMKLGESGKALADLNYIRQRAGLSPLSDPQTSRRTMCLIPSEEISLNKKLVQNEY